MSNSTSQLDLISSSQASKEVTANALFDAAFNSMLFGRRSSKTAGLTWGYYGGNKNVSGTPTFVANGTVTLTAGVTNYVRELNGVVSVVTSAPSGWPGPLAGGYNALYEIITGSSTVTSYLDWRMISTTAGNNGAGYGGTSTTSLTIGTGSKVFTTQSNLAYVVGSRLRAASNATPTNYMEGIVTAYSGTSLTISSDTVGGSGTAADWNLTIGGGSGVFTGGTLTSALNYAPPVTIASASSVAIGAAAANDITISGTTTITSFDTIAAGARRTTTFSGILLLTYNATSLIIPGAANLTTAAGDVAEWISLGSGNWRCIDYTKANGTSVVSSGGGGLTDFTDAISTATPNATIPVVSLTATNAATNVDIALVPKGTGALTGTVANNLASGGNKRGTNAVDWQTNRTAAADVASGFCSTIGGGQNNQNSGGYGTVAGGNLNNVSGQGAVIAGGSSNTASSNNSTVGGGFSNNSSNFYSTIAGGNQNTASNTASTVGGGIGNICGGWKATIGGGALNTANGTISTIPGGQSATDRGITGLFCYATGMNTTQGDAQIGKYVMRIKTTTATPIAITTDGGAAGTSNQVALPNNASYSFSGRVTARNTSTGDSASYQFSGLIKQGASAATTALVAAVTVTTVAADTGASSWVVAVTADTTNGALLVTVTGAASTNIAWVGVVDTVEATN